MKNEIVKASQLYIGNKLYIVSNCGEIHEDYIETLNVTRTSIKVTLSISDYLNFELYSNGNNSEYTIRQEEWCDEYFFDEKRALSRAAEKTKAWLVRSREVIESATKQLEEYEAKLSEINKK